MGLFHWQITVGFVQDCKSKAPAWYPSRHNYQWYKRVPVPPSPLSVAAAEMRQTLVGTNEIMISQH